MPKRGEKRLLKIEGRERWKLRAVSGRVARPRLLDG